jgi:hypothetical protein
MSATTPVHCPKCSGKIGTVDGTPIAELNCAACEEKYALHVAPGEAAPHLAGPRLLHLVGMDSPVQVRLAAGRDDWEQAFRLVARAYQTRGYDRAAEGEFHFTRFHALPETVVLVAKERERVIATISVVMDNTLLGLPLEDVYGEEIQPLRRAGRRLCEAGSLGDSGVGPHKFASVFVALIRLAWQFICRQGGDTGVVTCHPRHSYFYRHVLGFNALGGPRDLPPGSGFPVEAFVADTPLLQANAPEMYRLILGQPLPSEMLSATPMPDELKLEFADHSCRTNRQAVEEILRHVHAHGSPRRW